MLDRLGTIEARYQELSDRLSDPEIARRPNELQRLAREAGDLRETVEAAGRYRQALARRDEAQQIVAAVRTKIWSNSLPKNSKS